MYLLLSEGALSHGTAYAQTASEPAKTGLSPRERFAISTNTVDWLLSVPNIQVSWDLSSSVYNHDVALLGLKYNWNTAHHYVPYYVFNVFSVRPQYRKYFRQTQRRAEKTGELNPDGTPVLSWEKVPFLTSKRKNPKPWQAWYMGVYADFTSYTLKLSQTGHQGFEGGAGVTIGFEQPLYRYNNSALDVDFGLSAGLIVTSDKAFRSGPNLYAYAPAPEKDRPFMLLPMLTEVRVAFTWRKLGVADKYNRDDPTLAVYAGARSDVDMDASQTRKEDFDEYLSPEDKERYAKNDSLYRARYVESWSKTKEDRRNKLLDERNYELSQKQRAKLIKYLDRRFGALLRDFDKKLATQKKKKNADE